MKVMGYLQVDDDLRRHGSGRLDLDIQFDPENLTTDDEVTDWLWGTWGFVHIP